jgi:glucose uptake protein
MILPATTLACVILLALTLLCWGSWANSQRLVFKWRFELFYYDFALGALLCGGIAALVLGNLNPQELNISDNMVLAGYRKIAFAVAAGALVNLATILMVASISISGMTIAFPLTFGIGLVITSVMNFIGAPQSMNAILLFGGAILILAAIVVDIFAYRSHLDGLAALSKAGPMLDPRTRLPVKAPLAPRGIVLAVLAGIIYGFFFPLIDASRGGDNGVGPYGIAGLLVIGLFVSTLLYVPFFVNFPVFGAPVNVLDYFKGAKKQHFWGIFGGIVWAAGLVAALVAASSPAARPLVAPTTALVNGAPILAALWGILVWQEFKGCATGVKMMLTAMLVVFAAGLALISIAPLYAAK